MDSSLQSTSPSGAAEKMLPFTWSTLALIFIGAIIVIAAIWWGMRLRRERHRAEGATESQELPASELRSPEPAAAEPVPEAIQTPPATPPVTPPPPPLADAETVASQPVPAPPPIAPEPAPPATADAGAGDELTTLKGVGPKVATRLNELGITSFAKLAALSPEQAAAIDAELGNFKGRMERDRWQEQAALLAAGDRAGYEAKFGKLG